jgi:hypothetical protein
MEVGGRGCARDGVSGMVGVLGEFGGGLMLTGEE